MAILNKENSKFIKEKEIDRKEISKEDLEKKTFAERVDYGKAKVAKPLIKNKLKDAFISEAVVAQTAISLMVKALKEEYTKIVVDTMGLLKIPIKEGVAIKLKKLKSPRKKRLTRSEAMLNQKVKEYNKLAKKHNKMLNLYYQNKQNLKIINESFKIIPELSGDPEIGVDVIIGAMASCEGMEGFSFSSFKKDANEVISDIRIDYGKVPKIEIDEIKGELSELQIEHQIKLLREKKGIYKGINKDYKKILLKNMKSEIELRARKKKDREAVELARKKEEEKALEIPTKLTKKRRKKLDLEMAKVIPKSDVSKAGGSLVSLINELGSTEQKASSYIKKYRSEYHDRKDALDVNLAKNMVLAYRIIHRDMTEEDLKLGYYTVLKKDCKWYSEKKLNKSIETNSEIFSRVDDKSLNGEAIRRKSEQINQEYAQLELEKKYVEAQYKKVISSVADLRKQKNALDAKIKSGIAKKLMPYSGSEKQVKSFVHQKEPVGQKRKAKGKEGTDYFALRDKAKKRRAEARRTIRSKDLEDEVRGFVTWPEKNSSEARLKVVSSLCRTNQSDLVNNYSYIQQEIATKLKKLEELTNKAIARLDDQISNAEEKNNALVEFAREYKTSSNERIIKLQVKLAKNAVLKQRFDGKDFTEVDLKKIYVTELKYFKWKDKDIEKSVQQNSKIFDRSDDENLNMDNITESYEHLGEEYAQEVRNYNYVREQVQNRSTIINKRAEEYESRISKHQEAFELRKPLLEEMKQSIRVLSNVNSTDPEADQNSIEQFILEQLDELEKAEKFTIYKAVKLVKDLKPIVNLYRKVDLKKINKKLGDIKEAINARESESVKKKSDIKLELTRDDVPGARISPK